MASWTLERSAILSLMLDEVSGTEEMVAIRQDFCRVVDCMTVLLSEHGHVLHRQQGRRAEPPGQRQWLYVVTSMADTTSGWHRRHRKLASRPLRVSLLSSSVLTMSTPASLCWDGSLTLLLFLILSYYAHLKICTAFHISAAFSSRVKRLQAANPGDGATRVIQGPSIETWNEYMDRSESGYDLVPSIHCPFWPRGAEEWLHRPRRYGWPTPTDITQITDFGCHLVAVGFPLSSSKEMEWRISFSVAERILVWSFNHVQIQCYAVMKIILKEFIKVRCSPPNYVLCSYFIKTFLFWKFEVTESTFWRAENFRACISFLLVEFTKCIRNRELPHYFFPSFNLLSVKLTREAQRELLPILQTAIEHDIAILRECNTLRESLVTDLQQQMAT